MSLVDKQHHKESQELVILTEGQNWLLEMLSPDHYFHLYVTVLSPGFFLGKGGVDYLLPILPNHWATEWRVLNTLYKLMTRFHDKPSPWMEEQICRMWISKGAILGDRPVCDQSIEFFSHTTTETAKKVVKSSIHTTTFFHNCNDIFNSFIYG